MFQPGDIVRCIDPKGSGCGGFIPGETYVVKGPWGDWGIDVEKDSKGGTSNGWMIDCFELVSQSTTHLPEFLW